jgi:hypothetical protein
MKAAHVQFIIFPYPSSLSYPDTMTHLTARFSFLTVRKTTQASYCCPIFNHLTICSPSFFIDRRGDIIATPIRQSTNALQVSWFISWSLTRMEIILIHIRWRPCLGPFAITICDVLSLGSLRYSTRAGFRKESMAPDPSILPWALSPLFC